MKTYFVKQICESEINKKCIQGFFLARNIKSLFWNIDEKYNPYDFIFAEIKDLPFGVYFNAQDFSVNKDCEDDVGVSDCELSSDDLNFQVVGMRDMDWKTWEKGSLGKKTIKVNILGELK